MRKVFALLMGLFLLAMLAACSEDETTPPPPPQSLEITTAAVPAGYTCGPYHTNLEATGGTAPYTWTLASGSSMPNGASLSAEGEIAGVMTVAGDYTFTVRCTDSASPPNWIEKELSLSMSVPSNPSIAVFFDQGATICSSATSAWTPLDCYLYIMLDGSDVGCAQACEFKVRLTDDNNVDIQAGPDTYGIWGSSVADGSIWLGDYFYGIAISFSQPHFGPDPIYVGMFQLTLMMDMTNLSIKFERNPGGNLAIATCDNGYPVVPVTGREAAINY